MMVALLTVPLSPSLEFPSIRAGALAIDQSGLPDLSRFDARDGTSLAYRFYPSADGGMQKIAILFHGSAGHPTGMNEVAKRLAAETAEQIARAIHRALAAHMPACPIPAWVPMLRISAGPCLRGCPGF
jgi:hypothetical protein